VKKTRLRKTNTASFLSLEYVETKGGNNDQKLGLLGPKEGEKRQAEGRAREGVRKDRLDQSVMYTCMEGHSEIYKSVQFMC
jgi:hypothetical protein